MKLRAIAFAKRRSVHGILFFLQVASIVGAAICSPQTGLVAQDGWRIELGSGDFRSSNSWTIDNGQFQDSAEGDETRLELSRISKFINQAATRPTAKPQWEIGLRDSGNLFCVNFSSLERVMLVGLASGAECEMPRTEVRFVRRIGEDLIPKEPREWQTRLAESASDEDALGLIRDSGWRWVDGKVGAIDEDSIELTIGDQTAKVPKERIEGILFGSTLSLAPVTGLATLELVDGSRIYLSRLRVAEGTVQAQTLRGTPFTVPLELVALIDLESHRVQWLSDLKPSTIDWQPLLASTTTAERLRAFNLPRFNQAQDGSPLRIDVEKILALRRIIETETFLQGMTLPAGSRLAFALNGQYRKLTGLIGFAPAALKSDVRLVIVGDGRVLFERLFDPLADDVAREISVDLSGVERVVFETHYHGGRSVGAVLHFCQAQIWK
jgi:hypothetical protein